MNNYQIADSFMLLSKLMEIHGENSFKSKSYSSAAFSIEKFTEQLSEMPIENIATIKGIGASSAQKIIELINTGELKILKDLILSTPQGVLEMLNIKGLGPKKINTIWKEMEVESVGELLYACKENRLKLYKGFGEKTQQNVIDIIEFYLHNKGSHLYVSVEKIVPEVTLFIEQLFDGSDVFLTGEFIRQMQVINELIFIVRTDHATAKKKMDSVPGFSAIEENPDALIYRNGTGVNIRIVTADENNVASLRLKYSSSESFYAELTAKLDPAGFATEENYFQALKVPFIPAFARENPKYLLPNRSPELSSLIQPGDIKGIIHAHSTYSDGSNTLEEMAQAAIDRGMEYLVNTDHSKSAFYANGLQESRIADQHLHIEQLNKTLAPFRIFKSIESDILNDGSLDYNDEVLKRFDLVIASVHSNLKMNVEKAMSRLIKAIENPYTRILGHMTGRLLLSREGYPVEHFKIIDACAANGVVIELNANPNRLDMDWKYLDYAMSKEVLISINPDAHSLKGMDDTKYAVLVAQKALLTKEQNLSSFTLQEFEAFLARRKF